ncbi:hypothetical protein G6F62_001710 [Rhizopus arrhizus]|uniref:Uncharacterized protein n=1 Tax=Rhizopus oryzae TaxID=64495 RepID=A0A9P6X8C7_RHIOR|nr:hypothetical protein G6F64_006609 [Rhizopus arrhizus]KAG1357335.1 hypothetical protein G6F62_001710 [Rhizopus arrhizus]KAG1406812.1 hypothetical protein G6F60_002659 [Rhizopus arrhizus]
MPIPAPSTNPLYSLLGSSPTSSAITSYLPSNASPIITKVSNYVYYAYKPLGMSFGFVNQHSTLVLDSLDIHNSQTRDGFEPFQKQEDLPCGLRSDMQGHEIVSLLGEPDKKGGGGRARTPCWIEYLFDTTRESGIVIQLHGVEWEDREMGWTSFVLY